MSDKYEDVIDCLEELGCCADPYDEKNKDYQGAITAAVDALVFVENLNNILRENGADRLPEDPDVDQLSVVIDGVFSELAAASLFLSEKSFAKVPDMLRGIADAIERDDYPFTDASGETGTSVPPVIVKGFRDFAKRLEATQKQKQQVLGNLRKVEKGT